MENSPDIFIEYSKTEAFILPNYTLFQSPFVSDVEI